MWLGLGLGFLSLAGAGVHPNMERASMSEAEYEALQASKLGDSFGAANASASQKRMEGYIRRFDAQIAHELLEYLQRPTIQHCVLSPVLCVGARLGGEVHAFQLLPQVSLAVGVDLNPGLRNPHVLYGDGQRLEQFKNASFGTIFTNVLDHVLKIEKFAAAAHRVLRPNGTLLTHLYLNTLREDAWAVHDVASEHANICATLEAAGFAREQQLRTRNKQRMTVLQLVYRRV